MISSIYSKLPYNCLILFRHSFLALIGLSILVALLGFSAIKDFAKISKLSYSFLRFSRLSITSFSSQVLYLLLLSSNISKYSLRYLRSLFIIDISHGLAISSISCPLGQSEPKGL